MAVVVVVATALLIWERCGLRGCPDVERLSGYVPDEASVLVDRNGRELAKLYRVHRVLVPLDSLPAYVPAAFVAIEDRRFWEHDGVDWPRVLGAAWANVRALGIEEGFSTITMQLARNVFPERLPVQERTLSRKLAEMRVAKEIEDRFTKEQILSLYLNQIYFGGGAWGIEAAAREYFSKPASALTLPEAALLAGLIRAPNRLNPRVAPRAALARRAVVLQRMANERMISLAEAREAMQAPLELARGEASSGIGEAPYFVEETRRVLEERFGYALYTQGYTIRTTLDLDVQEVAETELERQLDAIESGRYGAFRHPGRKSRSGDATGRTRYLQGAIAVLDARTGDVLALVGGRDFADSKFNRATQALRQPGSAFKPFVYAAAIAAGYPPTYALSDQPLSRVLADGTVWTPRNFGGGYAGTVTLRNGLVQSRNVATIRLADAVGLDAVIEMAQRLGLGNRIPHVPSIVIGAAEVTLLQLTAAYAAFATLGERPEPRFVLHVEDRQGRVVWRTRPYTRQVLDPGVAFITTDLMRDVLDRGTGTAVRAVGFRGHAAGKTGTTNDATDVWFIGFTPRLVAGVWIGFDRPDRIVAGATGGRLAAPVWGRLMRRIAPPDENWIPPPGIEARLVDGFGNVFAPWCTPFGPVRQEYFLAGTAPPPRCAAHHMWPDSAGPDLLGAPADEEDARWQELLRRRLFGPLDADSTGAGGTLPGEAFPRPPGTEPDGEFEPGAPGPPPSGRAPDTLPGGQGRPPRARPDEGSPELLGRPVPYPRGRKNSVPAPPDTVRRPGRGG